MAESIAIPFATNAAAISKQIWDLTRAEQRNDQVMQQVLRTNDRVVQSERRVAQATKQSVFEQKLAALEARNLAGQRAALARSRQFAGPAQEGVDPTARRRRVQGFVERIGSAGGIFSPLGQVGSAIGQAEGVGGRAGAALIGISVAAAAGTIAIQGMAAAEQEAIRVKQAEIDATKRFTDALKGASAATATQGASSALQLDPLRRQLAARTLDRQFAEGFQRSREFQGATERGFAAPDIFNAAIASSRPGEGFNNRIFQAAQAAAATGEIGLTEAAQAIAGNRRISRGLTSGDITARDAASQLIASRGDLTLRQAESSVIAAGVRRNDRLGDRTRLAGRLQFAGAQTENNVLGNVAEVGLRRQVFAAENPLEAARQAAQAQVNDLISTKAELASQETRILEGLRDLVGLVGLGAGSQQTQFTREAEAINAGAAAGGAP